MKMDQAEDLKIYLETLMDNITGVILGEDNSAADSQHKVLVLGITKTGKDLAGFESWVIWT